MARIMQLIRFLFFENNKRMITLGLFMIALNVQYAQNFSINGWLSDGNNFARFA